MKIDVLGQKFKKKCYQRFILSLIPSVIYVQSHAASECSGFSSRVPSPLQPGQSWLCHIKFMLFPLMKKPKFPYPSEMYHHQISSCLDPKTRILHIILYQEFC